MATLIHDEYLALNKAGALVSHGEDFEQVLVSATAAAQSAEDESPNAQVLIVKGSLVTKS